MSRRESTTSGTRRFSDLANIMVNVFFSGELKRKDDLLASMDKKQDEAREKMQEVNMNFPITFILLTSETMDPTSLHI